MSSEEEHTVKDTDRLHIGDVVYIRGRVSDVPNQYNGSMYRIVTDAENTVVWCKEEELAKIWL